MAQIPVLQWCRLAGVAPIRSWEPPYAVGAALKKKKKKGKKRAKVNFTGVPAVVQWVNDPACCCSVASSIPRPAQWVKDPALLQLWCRSQMWLGFDCWPGNFHML